MWGGGGGFNNLSGPEERPTWTVCKANVHAFALLDSVRQFVRHTRWVVALVTFIHKKKKKNLNLKKEEEEGGEKKRKCCKVPDTLTTISLVSSSGISSAGLVCLRVPNESFESLWSRATDLLASTASRYPPRQERAGGRASPDGSILTSEWDAGVVTRCRPGGGDHRLGQLGARAFEGAL